VMFGRTGELRRAYYIRSLALGEKAAKETRVFGLASWLVDGYRAGWLAVMRRIWSKRREGWLAAVGGYLLVAGPEGFVLAPVAREAAAGALPLGRAVTIVGAVLAAGTLALFHNGHGWLADAALALRELEAVERAARHPLGVDGGTREAEALPRRSIRFE